MAKNKGRGDRLKGKAKEAMGKATGNERMEAEGRTDKAKGHAKKAVGDTKDRVRGVDESLRDES
ncbi:CsbD family protein [Streptomyces sp. PKU-EA00015]|uniref:CsbD family protein n=1 Tax=Streptomyces sp. PKU-EA00015 TaxID=2748326 RepID=UPI0015A1AC11|nr:CsbD family protein [Streptomyces sp. PKU-EA00015]NWF28760.1 CsbD family protein [Streptomyces sp. PKU-EA00015]